MMQEYRLQSRGRNTSEWERRQKPMKGRSHTMWSETCLFIYMFKEKKTTKKLKKSWKCMSSSLDLFLPFTVPNCAQLKIGRVPMKTCSVGGYVFFMCSYVKSLCGSKKPASQAHPRVYSAFFCDISCLFEQGYIIPCTDRFVAISLWHVWWMMEACVGNNFTLNSAVLSVNTHLVPEQLQHLVEAFVDWELSSFQDKIWFLGTLIVWVDTSETWEQM